MCTLSIKFHIHIQYKRQLTKHTRRTLLVHIHTVGYDVRELKKNKKSNKQFLAKLHIGKRVRNVIIN